MNDQRVARNNFHKIKEIFQTFRKLFLSRSILRESPFSKLIALSISNVVCQQHASNVLQ